MTSPIVIDSPAAMRAWSQQARSSGNRVALVPTMGALHEGHLALIAEGRRLADRVVVSIFVNPKQFGEQADFDKYPRPIDDDIGSCAHAGVDAVFAPTAPTMYPPGFDTNVVVGGLARPMEGESRPGHFDGVATIVTKLFAVIRPDLAVFGQKDFQQLAIIRRLAADLDLGVEIVGSPTVREADGVALSSRNRRLAPDERVAAACIPRAIDAAVRRARDPGATTDEVLDAARSVVIAEPLATLDYVEVFEPDTLRAIGDLTAVDRRPGTSRIAMAVRIGPVRLIDNDDLFAR